MPLAPLLPLLLACTAGPPDDSDTPDDTGAPEQRTWDAYGEGAATLSFASDDDRWDASFTIPGYSQAALEAVGEQLDQVATPVLWLMWERGEWGVLSASVDACGGEESGPPHRGELELWVPLGEELAEVREDCAEWQLEGVWMYVGWNEEPLSELTAFVYVGQLQQFSIEAGARGPGVLVDDGSEPTAPAGSVRYDVDLYDDYCGVGPTSVEVRLDWDLEGPLTTATTACGG